MSIKYKLLLVAIVVVAAVFTTIGNLASPASACVGIGCIEQGGPGASGLSPPEVSGCHYFATGQELASCASGTPHSMGQGPKN
jgi:hypothetical protein